jgi:hypothetical protein
MNKRRLANGQVGDQPMGAASGWDPQGRALRKVYQTLWQKTAQRLLRHLHGVCLDTFQVRRTMTTTKSREF